MTRQEIALLASLPDRELANIQFVFGAYDAMSRREYYDIYTRSTDNAAVLAELKRRLLRR